MPALNLVWTETKLMEKMCLLLSNLDVGIHSDQFSNQIDHNQQFQVMTVWKKRLVTSIAVSCQPSMLVALENGQILEATFQHQELLVLTVEDSVLEPQVRDILGMGESNCRCVGAT